MVSTFAARKLKFDLVAMCVLAVIVGAATLFNDTNVNIAFPYLIVAFVVVILFLRIKYLFFN
ncbi:MAG: hypothetical protein V1875_01050 [Candidatus Altiarchaeota archaeon]